MTDFAPEARAARGKGPRTRKAAVRLARRETAEHGRAGASDAGRHERGLEEQLLAACDVPSQMGA